MMKLIVASRNLEKADYNVLSYVRT
jgi:hypothetical protein